MRVVIDTNVFISSFFGGNPRKVIDYWILFVENPKENQWIKDDPKDNKFIACAIALKADYNYLRRFPSDQGKKAVI